MTAVFVPGVPRPQPRPRVYGKRTVSDSPDSRAWKDVVAWTWRQSGADMIAEGPVEMTVDLTLPRPKRLMRRKDVDSPVPCDRRPDIDNHLKAIMDGLQGVAFADDGQVAAVLVRKWYCGKDGEGVGAAIIVRAL